MKSYTITVNGNVYDVTVEETSAAGAAAPAAPRAAAAAPAPKAAPAAGAGSISITAAAAGKVLEIAAPVGTQVKPGDPVVILEIMKMETPVVASEAGTIASIEVSAGQSVATGDLLATMN